jgi:hypothetical protein
MKSGLLGFWTLSIVRYPKEHTLYVCVRGGHKTSPCTATFNDLLRFPLDRCDDYNCSCPAYCTCTWKQANIAC